jgi:hypothetical protein
MELIAGGEGGGLEARVLTFISCLLFVWLGPPFIADRGESATHPTAPYKCGI